MPEEIKIYPDDVCKTCGHTFRNHGHNIVADEQTLDGHVDCKMLVGWWCPKCSPPTKKILTDKDVRAGIKEVDGIQFDKNLCNTCDSEVFMSQCQCTNFMRVVE